MAAHRILIFGNSGSGKTTMAGKLTRELGIPHLDLDQIAWETPRVRRDLPASITLLEDFIRRNPDWVIEGCYGDLVKAAAAHGTELRFLNPGVEACIAHCRGRPWEPSKYPTKAEQDRLLEFLIGWVRQYDERVDEFGLAAHRAIFDAFVGPKKEYRSAIEAA